MADPEGAKENCPDTGYDLSKQTSDCIVQWTTLDNSYFLTVGVINHIGPEGEHGHYVATCRSKAGNQFCYNDEHVSPDCGNGMNVSENRRLVQSVNH